MVWSEAAYTPLAVEGSKSEHAIAYLRGDSLAVVVPRLTVKLGGTWRETTVTLPEGDVDQPSDQSTSKAERLSSRIC